MLYAIPPAGTRIEWKTLIRTIGSPSLRRADALSRFSALLKRRVGARHTWLTSSGSAALTILLEALALGADRDEVIVPAYTCPQVAAAVLRSGRRVVLCDMAPGSLAMDGDMLVRLARTRTLSVVAVELCGLPADLAAPRRVREETGAPTILDASQSFLREGLLEGVDAAFVSFGRGKPLCLMQGGAIFTDSDEIAARVEDVLARRTGFPGPRHRGAMVGLISCMALLHPRIHWLPRRLPFLHLGETRYDMAFPVTGMDPAVAAVGCEVASSLNRHVAVAVEKGKFYYKALRAPAAQDRIRFLVDEDSGAGTPMLRFPLILSDPERMARTLGAFERVGFPAVRLYPSPLPMIRGAPLSLTAQSPFQEAQTLSRSLITLPTHFLVKREYMDRAVDLLWKV